MKSKGYKCSSVNSSCGSPNMNLLKDCVSPMNSPKESIILKYLRSGLPFDHDYSSSPNKSRPFVNYNMSGSSKSSISSRSPLSAVENLEEDVLVMDGILVDSNKVSKNAGKFRSPTNSDSSPNSGINLYKTELCMSWEDTGACRYGYKCQFAHGKEELRPTHTRFCSKKTLEIIDPYYSPQSSPSSSGTTKLALEPLATPSPAKEEANSRFNNALLTPVQPCAAPTVTPNLTNTDWSPMDDGIAVKLPSSIDKTPSRQAVDEHIQSVICGPFRRKRLPVFVGICSG